VKAKDAIILDESILTCLEVADIQVFQLILWLLHS